jgi:hypothetical protein
MIEHVDSKDLQEAKNRAYSLLHNEQKWFEQMRSLLHYNVPRFIKHIGQRGGVSEED